ncbi:uncharacterized protein LOC103189297 [Callorhinchus milii]|uniref:TNF superfamily member 8 n=1 Tax=Callorhinchus milii TaxID=7868 RepID=UPI0004571E88|nr:TNF superfamily member 8 [Callorhinchus milii]|eukprot:gi/632981891/ref/XP_007907837.1/ PREDICTED: uncharacterized protein LOC103189297 [Callorhinchus milii]
MSSLTEVNYPEGRTLDRRSEHRNTKFINVACLFLTLLSTAVSIGTIVLFRTQQHCSQTAPVSSTGTIIGTVTTTRPELPTRHEFFQASSTGTVTPIRPEVPTRHEFFQGLMETKGQKLLWYHRGLPTTQYNVTVAGTYLVHLQVTFRGDQCRKNVLLKLTLYESSPFDEATELLVTSASVCEDDHNSTNWTRSLSQVAVVYLGAESSLYVTSTSMEHVDINHNKNNIFGVAQLQH